MATGLPARPSPPCCLLEAKSPLFWELPQEHNPLISHVLLCSESSPPPPPPGPGTPHTSSAAAQLAVGIQRAPASKASNHRLSEQAHLGRHRLLVALSVRCGLFEFQDLLFDTIVIPNNNNNNNSIYFLLSTAYVPGTPINALLPYMFSIQSSIL